MYPNEAKRANKMEPPSSRLITMPLLPFTKDSIFIFLTRVSNFIQIKYYLLFDSYKQQGHKITTKKRFGIQFPPTPKINWCLGLMIKNIIRSGYYRLKLSKKKKGLLRASVVGLRNAKCKVHLAYRPKTCSATGRGKV